MTAVVVPAAAGLRRWAAPVAALAAGVLHTAAFAPAEAWPLQVLALALLAGLAADASPRRAALLGGAFGFGWLCSGWWWIYISMHRYGGMPAPLAAAAVVLLSAAMSLYYAAALAGWARWRRPGQAPWALAAGFAACWLLGELARGVLLTGFPWIASGYAHTRGPLAGWAPWIGVYGIATLAAWLAAAMGLAARWGSKRRALGVLLVPPLALVLAGWVLPRDFTRDAGSLRVSLLQPNTAQEQKFDPERARDILQWHVGALAQARGTLVLTPESSIPVPAALLDESWQAALREPFERGERAALVGIFLGDDQQGWTNSLIALSARSGFEQPAAAYRYGKRHLLPFGEFIPPGFGWFVAMMNIPIGDQARGDSSAPLAVGGQRVRPVICYEDLFGEDMVDSVVGPEAATVFANATNLAWFGSFMVQDQHLQFSRMRALEFQRPMVRATNTGITGVVDHLGELTARLPSDTEGVLETEVHGRTGVTPYARWLHALGLWPLAVLALAALALLRRA